MKLDVAQQHIGGRVVVDALDDADIEEGILLDVDPDQRRGLIGFDGGDRHWIDLADVCRTDSPRGQQWIARSDAALAAKNNL